MADRRLVIVSNRGPASSSGRGRQRRGAARRRRAGHGAQRAGRASRRAVDRVGDDRRGHRGEPRGRRASRSTLELDGVTYEVLPGRERPEAYDRFYNVIANPILWFIQHYLWDLSNAPDIRQRGGRRLGPRLQGRQRATSRDAVLDAIDGRGRAAGDAPRLPPLHLPRRSSATRGPDAFLHHFVHIPWSQPDSWRILPGRHARGDLPRPARQRHHRLPHHGLLPQLPALLPRADGARGRLRARRGPARRAARPGCAPTRSAIDAGRLERAAASERGRSSTRRRSCAAAATT